MGSITATSLLSSADAITMNSGADYRWMRRPGAGTRPTTTAPPCPPASKDWWRRCRSWTGDSVLEAAGRDALAALAQLRPLDFDLYDPTNHPNGYQPAGGANYSSSFGMQLQRRADDQGQPRLNVATIDIGGWDTHQSQGNPANSYDKLRQSGADAVGGVERLLHRPCRQRDQPHDPGRVVVMTEFGRRVRENPSGGTDHGYGSVMLVLGGSVNGGQVYGNFLGLDQVNLFEYADVQVTTDYRRVLSEAPIRRQGNPNIYYAFPATPATARSASSRAATRSRPISTASSPTVSLRAAAARVVPASLGLALDVARSTGRSSAIQVHHDSSRVAAVTAASSPQAPRPSTLPSSVNTRKCQR